jgi:hypothetical protein
MVGALAVAGLLLVAQAGRAASPGPAVAGPAGMGQMVSGVFEIAGKQVPLPRGAWVVAATAVQPQAASAAPYGVVRSAVLLLQDGDQVRALLEVNTNDIAVAGGWVEPCGNDPLPPRRRLRYRSRFDSSCAETAATRLDESGPAAWQEARAGIGRAGLHMPPTMLTAMALCADRQDFLEVRVHLRAVPGADDAARQQILLDWAVQYAAALEHGLSRRLDGIALEWPGRSALLQEDPVLERRLRRIEALRRTGVITSHEAAVQELAAVQEVPRSAVDPHPRVSLLNRITSPLINLGTAYSVTRNVTLSVGIAASEYLARQIVATTNNAQWDAIGRVLVPAATPMPELTHIGRPAEEAEPSGLAALVP